MGDMADFYTDMYYDWYVEGGDVQWYAENEVIEASIAELPTKELIDRILKCNKDELNSVVPYGSFPAWDVAFNLKDNGWTPTEKQLQALRNVFTHYEELNNREGWV